MSSEKGKGVTTSTRKTRQAPVDKVPLKQKTLIDSFFVRSASKGAVTNSVSGVETQGGELIAQDELSNNAAIPPLDNNSVEADIIIIDDPLESNFRILSPPLERLRPDNNKVLEENTSINISDTTSEHRRSPSVVIIEHETSLPPATTIRPSASQRHPTPEGKTPDKAIVIASSPVKPPAKPNRPIHPFFGARAKISSSSRTPASKKSIPHIPQIPSYPDLISQHVRGLQTNILGPPSIFPRRATKPNQQDLDGSNYAFLKRATLKALPPRRTYRISDRVNGNILSNIPENHKSNHPAITQMLDGNLQESFTSRRPWSDKWRPTCAQEVLGNEKSAIYLRNWLKALELQLEEPAVSSSAGDDVQPKRPKAPKRGLKRARIIRSIEKKKKRSRIDSEEEDDWIVQSEESESEGNNYEIKDDLDDLFLDPPSSSPASAPDFPPSSFQETPKQDKPLDLGQLHNTILLTGPYGSGKTASVYACAEELGWDVFEVYPGIGRRNGANVDNLVGEVGKNHLVLQNRQSGDVLRSFLWQKNKSETFNTDSSTNDFQSAYSPRKKTTKELTPDLEDSANSGVKPIRQSLILLEEVDILYKEDTNFWTTVLRMIKDCKRPVICTCNDISLVPIEELPLQSILYFEPCSPGIAISYLQGLCMAEGHLVEKELVSSLYMDPTPEQQCSDIFSAKPLPKQDLRRTINALQVVCTTANSVEYTDSRSNLPGHIDIQDGPFLSQGKSLISMKRSESLSFLDGVLPLGSIHNPVPADFTGYLTSDDDEIGHVILHDRYVQDVAQFGMYDRHEDILTTAIRLSQELFDVDVKADALKTEAFEEQSRNVRAEQQVVLQELCPTAIWARRDARIALDYIPLIRQMVDADDRQEALEMEKKRGSGRSTRNSARSGYVRMIGITQEGRRLLGTSRLGS